MLEYKPSPLLWGPLRRGYLLAMLVIACTAAADNTALEACGYPPNDYTLVYTWQERASAHDAFVTGYRVRAHADGALTDVYRLGDHCLDSREAATLGIAHKNWQPRPVRAAATLVQPGARKAQKRTMRVPEGNVAFAKHIAVSPPESPADLRTKADGATNSKGVLQIGEYRPMTPPLSVTTTRTGEAPWQRLPNGDRLWAALVEAPGASGLRLGFTHFELPQGAYVMVYNLLHPEEAYGPFDTIGADRDVLWTPTCFGERVVVACRVPAGAATGPVRLAAEKAVYVYAGFAGFLREKGSAGSCNLDVTCYPEWADTATGVMGLGMLGQDGFLFCTGSLIADVNPFEDLDLVLTANHCVGNDAEADTLEFYWLYQTATCDGAAPDPATVPRTTGGAEQLANMDGGASSCASGNDFSLLEMRNAPPAGVTRLGWTTTPPPLDTPTSCIHHPRGDFKRIAFGVLTDTDNACSPYYHESTWSEGTTEPGSSGSPLFITETQEIIGQLWGGGASCLTPLEPDYYGRFNVTYPIIEQYLHAVEARFAVAQVSAIEDSGTVTIPITLSRAVTANGAMLYYTVEGDTAEAGADFVVPSGELALLPGTLSAEIVIDLIPDIFTEPDEQLTVTLESGSFTALAPAARTATVTIEDDDPDDDGDGLSNAVEISGYYGPPTDPNNPDTDSDGLTDRQELLETFTDPTRRDTDGDGIDDYDELLLGLDPLDSFDADKLPSIVVPWFSR
ncbi:MAG: Calx-beta domain-containing protein [Candidatus Hydrogenedentota bacterium]